MRISSAAALVWPCSFIAYLPVTAGAETRLGSTEKAAIVVSVPNTQLHDWEIAYLKKHFPEHYSFTGGLSSLNEEHRLIAHEDRGKWFDYYSFAVRGKKIEVYFDISKQVEEEYARSQHK